MILLVFAGDDERPFREEMKKVDLMTKIKKHNSTLWLIIVSFLFFALSPTSIAQAIPDESSMPSVNSQQPNQASRQENNNGNIGKGQEKTKDNKQNEVNPNQGKNSQSGNGNPGQGNNSKGNMDNNGADPNNQPGNNGKGNSNGNGNTDGNASSDKDKNRGSLNTDNANNEGWGVADRADSIVDAIGRGTKDAAEVLKAIPAKIVPAAVEAAEYLGAALAEKLEAIADFIQGIFGTTSPAMVSESTGATEG